MISDAAARDAALSPDRSFIVQAPAGSGKTGLLVYRMLTLLAQVDQPQQILAITFTRKATAEMRERLLQLMHAAEQGNVSADPFEQQGIQLARHVLARDAELGWNLLNTPHQLQIQTIDAFCAKLTASMPWLSRLGDRPKTTNNADAHYAAAVEELLNELLNPQSPLLSSLQTVLLELDFNYHKARTLFSSMLAKRDQWLRHLLHHDLPALRQPLEASWQAVIDQQLDELRTLLPDHTLAQLVRLAVVASSHISVKNDRPSMLAPFEGYDFVGEGENHRLSFDQWQALCRLLLVADAKSFRKTVDIRQGFVKGSPEKNEFTELLSEFADDTDLRHALAETMMLPQASFTDQDWTQLTALEQVLKALAALLQLRFRAAGECDHNEVTQRANLALQELDNPTDLGLRMDYHLQHILVDEFQDTSNGQIELLKKLTAGWSEQDAGPPKTLFLVGDPMQSIYRFREADVSLFLQVAQNSTTQVFDNLIIEPLQLSENFRSSQSLVDWFNDTFSSSFPKHNNVLTGAISYACASSNKAPVEQCVSYQLAHNKTQEAQLLVAQVQASIASLPTPNSQLAILVRSRGQLSHLLPALQAAGIAYAGVDIQPLKELQAVIDVLALCKAICREDDRIAWLALLRGPWCGMTLVEIKQLSSRHDVTIWQQLNSPDLTTLLSAESQQRLARFVGIMQQTLLQRQQVDLASLVRWSWRCLGGEQTLFEANREDIEGVFDLISHLQRGGDLPSMGELDKALDGLFAMPAQASEHCRVVVSTMHKSKGLQYDTVILPSLSSPPRAEDKNILMWAERQGELGETDLLLAPLRLKSDAGDHFDYLRKLESQRANNEAVRLMYVAVTRAERKLVLLACANKDEESNQAKPPATNSLLATIWSARATQFDFVNDVQEVDAPDEIEQTLQRLPMPYQTPFAPSIEWQVEQQLNAHDETDDELGEEQTEFEWATNAASAVGTILHRWLQYNDALVLNSVVDASLLQRWRAELIGLRVPDSQIEYAIGNLKTAVQNIQSDPQARFIFEQYPIQQNEYALSAFDNGMVKKSIIDRTFVDHDGVRWIIDYKSTPTQRQDLRTFAEEQVALRHKEQLERYGALMSQIDNRAIKLAVYFPVIKQLVSWSYQP